MYLILPCQCCSWTIIRTIISIYETITKTTSVLSLYYFLGFFSVSCVWLGLGNSNAWLSLEKTWFGFRYTVSHLLIVSEMINFSRIHIFLVFSPQSHKAMTPLKHDKSVSVMILEQH